MTSIPIISRWANPLSILGRLRRYALTLSLHSRFLWISFFTLLGAGLASASTYAIGILAFPSLEETREAFADPIKTTSLGKPKQTELVDSSANPKPGGQL